MFDDDDEGLKTLSALVKYEAACTSPLTVARRPTDEHNGL